MNAIPQAKLFVDVYTNNVAVFPLLLASTQRELAEAKDKLVAGLKVGGLLIKCARPDGLFVRLP